MSLLNSDAMLAMKDAIATGNTSNPPSEIIDVKETEFIEEVDEEKEVSNVDAPAAQDDTVNAEVQVKDEVVVEDSEENKTSHQVPYKRFKSVLDARNEFKSQADAHKEELVKLQNQISSLKDQQAATPDKPETISAESNEDDWLDNWLDDDSGEAGSKAWETKAQDLDKRIARFEFQQARVQLDKDVADAMSKHPNVPKQLLLQSVIQNPSVDLTVVAEHYASFVAGIEEKAIENYSQEATPSVAPRPRSTSSSKTSNVLADGQKKPRTFADAAVAMRNYLQSQK